MKTAAHDRLITQKELQRRGSRSIDLNADCQSITVNAPAAEVYRYCLRFEDIPQFIPSLRKLHRVNETRFSYASILNGKEVKCDVMIMMRVPARRIAWQAESNDFRVGVVFLDPLLGGRTKVTVKVRSNADSVLLAAAMRQYLRNFKSFVENSGDGATSW
jgi:uncharacterized membrane protein